MKILFLGAHIDDVDLMCGGTIAKLLDLGHEVSVNSFSHKYGDNDLRHELTDSAKILGYTNLFIGDCKTRFFHEKSDGLLQRLFMMGASNNYDYVFVHSEDMHTDHSIVSKAAQRVFKHTNLLAFQPDWNTRHFHKNYFVRLEQKHVDRKLEALRCYKSQKDKPYFNEDYLISNLRLNGLMANCKYAEAFQVINSFA